MKQVKGVMPGWGGEQDKGIKEVEGLSRLRGSKNEEDEIGDAAVREVKGVECNMKCEESRFHAHLEVMG